LIATALAAAAVAVAAAAAAAAAELLVVTVALTLTALALTTPPAFSDDDGLLEAATATAAAITAALSRPVDVAGSTVCPVTPTLTPDDAMTPLP
jgi:hypothetical protein